MHMSDALISPAVGGTMWALSGATMAYASYRLRREGDDRKVPLMGVMGAFLFTAQMINFTIPGTGSSGHLGGGLLLALLLGPWAGVLTIASVLVVQALFFADGGLLALGCNIFNMGVIPACLVYPLFFRHVAGDMPQSVRYRAGIVMAALISLQLGPVAVVLETYFSGITALPVSTFLLLMLPIHLAIGLVEGLVTMMIIAALHRMQPDILDGPIVASAGVARHGFRQVMVGVALVALVTGGGLSLVASEHPDGLEWAIARVTGGHELASDHHGVTKVLSSIQNATAYMPDYGFREEPGATDKQMVMSTLTTDTHWGTSCAGVIGGMLTLICALMLAMVVKKRQSVCR